MFNWFQRKEVDRVTYSDLQSSAKDTRGFIVSTLPASEQACLVFNTLPPREEERRLNDCLKKGEADRVIVVYGRNAGDLSAEKKCRQLVGLGFTSVRLYAGGLFEWALLQDIYGAELFPTTSVCTDPLSFA
tara:strand:- start:398 stop:790 length:393 start_codon:yes stop_codon:yes gene_type:complete